MVSTRVCGTLSLGSNPSRHPKNKEVNILIFTDYILACLLGFVNRRRYTSKLLLGLSPRWGREYLVYGRCNHLSRLSNS